jgi:tRNA-dihydrouridine synthase B
MSAPRLKKNPAVASPPALTVQIGPYLLENTLVVAPMAGVTDRPFRKLCRRFGAGFAISEMIASNPALRETVKTQRRMDHAGEVAPVSAQIAGADPVQLADAARFNVGHGAQIIDINMGCPAKKVCNVAAGSALLRDEALVERILEAVVAAVNVPVTLKIRTGWDRSERNAVRIARIAESAGIQALSVHGRTRADAFLGEAEYDTIAEVKARVSIPVIANGDIDGPEKARAVLRRTGADALMIGRAAQGRPWIFREIGHFLRYGVRAQPPSAEEIRRALVEHVAELHAFYGEFQGLRVARKHVSWYMAGLSGGGEFRQQFNRLESAQSQIDALEAFFRADARRDRTEHAREELAA